MAFFEQGFIEFFHALKDHNEREWFKNHKKEYETFVKEPFYAFVDHMIERMRQTNPEIAIQAKDAIFRIYRDTRFSKDKTPYKLHMSAVLGPEGRKNPNMTGIYIQFGEEDARVYSGCYQPDKDQLYNIRTYLSDYSAEFEDLISTPAFIKHFGEIQGEKNKRLPKEFQEAAEKQPLIFNKNFYYFKSFPAEIILEDNLDETLLKYHEVAYPVSEFLVEAMG